MSFNLDSFKKRFLEEARENLDFLTNGVILLESEPGNIDKIKELIRVAHTLKGSLKMMGYSEISKIIHEIEYYLTDLFDERVEIDGEKITELLHKIEEVRNLLFREEKEKQDIKKKGEKRRERKSRTELKKPKKEKVIDKETKVIVAKESSYSPVLNYVRVKFDDILEFSTIMEDSYYNISALSNLIENKEGIAKAKEVIDRIKNNISFLLSNLRNYQLIPLSLLFDVLPKSVRDLSMELEKEVELRIKGKNIKVEKKIFDQLSSILIHIIRNAIDHGIEFPEERVKAGKTKKGKLSIEAYVKRGKIYIEVKDDGRGINWQKLREKAEKLGLKEKGDELSPEELKTLLFYSGVSTKDKITEISGRGVGLDVVYSIVKKLNGNIELDSKEGKGTTIILSFPQMLSLVESLIFEIGGRSFAIPVSNVEKIFNKEKIKILNKNNNAYLYFLDQIIPLVDLKEILNISSTSPSFIIVVGEGGSSYGILVDNIVKIEDLILESKIPLVEKYFHILGTSFSESGEIIPILDPVNLIRTINLRAISIDEFNVKKIRVLIVEDSELTREIIYETLLRMNYEVEQAANGIEGLEKVETFNPDIILTDIDMPKMDGIQFFKHLKSRGFNKPVIFLSSHEEDETIRYVESIGASGFLKKSEFSPELVNRVIKKEFFNAN